MFIIIINKIIHGSTRSQISCRRSHKRSGNEIIGCLAPRPSPLQKEEMPRSETETLCATFVLASYEFLEAKQNFSRYQFKKILPRWLSSHRTSYPCNNLLLIHISAAAIVLLVEGATLCSVKDHRQTGPHKRILNLS